MKVYLYVVLGYAALMLIAGFFVGGSLKAMM
ncbi:hypothetical protein NIAMH_31 [Serratia phage vB_SmaS_Niamh]|uniref:Uncharacterized protein n=2 Tax=Bonzeevirus TaxID=3152507 RepID=A0A7T3TL21_9CAUD|nr:hypothetical protein QJS27_gp30 [Serratia phage vB_SmaS_Ulliraptor]YP_010774340.1 hypothetical protein QJS28_gp27 [Serratia phage vB_SmaS_Bigdog]QPX74394.1 hypothetical protein SERRATIANATOR_38 [Serratia phage vB_SmaS_Serratianator]QPX75363.1 hypothetical protein [Serratia phage vB_SmaS_Opt-148]UGO51768.1 hypothetical protein SWAIN_26 [Serratia phage vB_SmaS_Swain]UGO51832.1 hypothetical protein CARROT_26 [Serratia phage vB_SmaS_Carrot]UGO52985.1 hypothetical protein NIAMH_31 [Serratia pha